MHQLSAEEPVAPDSTLNPSPSHPPSSSPSPSPPPPLSLSPSSPLSCGVFQCLVCSSFSSDSLESLMSHLSAPCSLPQSEWRSLVAGGCYCRLCGYSTPLRANFTLHCQTDRHRAQYQLASHLWEKGKAGDREEFGKLVATGNPVQLKCNSCDFQTTSLDKLKIHSINPQHQASLRVYRFLQQYDSAVDGGSWLFHCVLCNYSSCSKLHLLRHTHSPGHQKRELHYLQLVRGRSLEEGEGLAATFTIRKCPSPETGGSIEEEGERRDSLSPAKRSFSGLEETQSPLSPKRPRTDQRSTHQQATGKCPLCQDTLVYTHLRRHLILTHSVVQDCVDKLMSVVAVELPEILQKETLQMESNSNIKEFQTNDCNTSSYTKESLTNESQTNDYHTKKEKVITAKDVPALVTPPCEDQHPAEDNTSHLLESPSSPPSPPTLSSLSPSNLPSSTLPLSPPSDAPPPSDCHGYRFCCSRCSLAVQRQNHTMRAATECHLCPRRCRSQEALQRHLLNTHLQDLHLQGTYPDQSGAHIQQPISLEEEEGESMSEKETDKKEEDDEEGEGEQGKGDEGEDEKDDPDEEEERPSSGVGDSDQGSRQQEEKEAGSEPNPFSKGSNPTLERFLDPAQPYKCSFCCESFTQRTILPVLYNSLSHRARARWVLQDSSPSSPDTRCSPDPSSYRCRMCRVAYSQSSALDIHLRSALHQTRARGARTQLSLKPHTLQTLVPALVQTTASSRSPGGGEVSTRETPPTATRSAPSSPSPCSSLSEAQLSVGVSGKAEGHQAKRRRVEDLTASGGQQDLTLLQQQLAQAQMLQQQHKLAQAHIQEHTVLLQPQLFSPTLLPHLPLLQQNLLKQFLPSAAESLQQRNLLSPLQFSPDSLFSLQQQMLQSFYLSGDLQLNPNMNISQITSALSLQTIASLSSQTNGLKHPSPKLVTTSIQSPAQPPKCETQAETADSDSPLHQMEKESNPSSSPEGGGEMQESEKRDGAEKALRVLLERYGWELALQSNQSRQRQQNREMEGCLEEEKQCGECGKLFSDSVILKSHREFVHQQMITPVVLETFSRQYDCLYPLTHFPVGDNDNTVVAHLATALVLAPLPPAPVSDSIFDQAQSLSQASIGPDQAVPTTLASVPVNLSTDQAPVNSFCPAQASPTPSPPPPSSQTQPLPEQQQDTTASTTTPAPSPTIIPQSNLSMHFPLSQLPMPPLPLPSLPTLPFPIDLSLLPLGLMQPIVLQSMLQYQSLLSSGHQPPLSLFTNAHSTLKPSLPSYTNTHCDPSPSLPSYTNTHCALSPSLTSYTNTHCAPSPSLTSYTNTHCAPSPSLTSYTNTHCAPSPSLTSYTNTHCAPSPSLTSYTNTHCAPSPSLTSYTNTHCAPSPSLPFLKRRLEEGTSVTPMRDVMDGEREEEGVREGDEQRRDRRQRTTISSEQLEVLYQRYSLNSNPTRSVLEGITRDTGLKKRVVQVWFQNTRARQRKGQLQTLGRGGGLCLGENHRRCPFCRALFKAQNALDAHVRAHHCSQTDRAAYGSFNQMGPAVDSSFSHNH